MSALPFASKRFRRSLVWLAALLVVFIGAAFTAMWLASTAQGRTRAALDKICWAMDRFAYENGRYPTALTIDALAEVLEPDYLRKVPRRDGWFRRLNVDSRGHTYTVWSNGSDGEKDDVWRKPSYDSPPSEKGTDMVVKDGDFYHYEVGMLGGWWSAWRVVRVAGLQDDEAGTVVVTVDRGSDRPCYPPPKVALMLRGEALGEVAHPFPKKFLANAGRYVLRVTLSSGQSFLTETSIRANKVVIEEVTTPWVCLKVTVPGNDELLRSDGATVRVLQNGRDVATDDSVPAYFQLLPGDYEVVLELDGIGFRRRQAGVSEDTTILLAKEFDVHNQRTK